MQIGSCLDVIIVDTSIYFGKCQLLVHAKLRETYPISSWSEKSMTHSVYKIVNSDCIIVSKFSAFKRNVGRKLELELKYTNICIIHSRTHTHQLNNTLLSTRVHSTHHHPTDNQHTVRIRNNRQQHSSQHSRTHPYIFFKTNRHLTFTSNTHAHIPTVNLFLSQHKKKYVFNKSMTIYDQ